MLANGWIGKCNRFSGIVVKKSRRDGVSWLWCRQSQLYSSNTVEQSVPLIGLLGVLEDRNGSFMHGPREGPPLIRNALYCESGNSFTEHGFDLSEALVDCGDIECKDQSASALYEAVAPKVTDIMYRRNMLPLFLGGDHSVSGSLVKAVSTTIAAPLYIVHFDAHPDIYENFEGNPSSHASQFARILEQRGLCAGLISLGIRTLTPHQRQQYSKYDVKVLEAKDFPSHVRL